MGAGICRSLSYMADALTGYAFSSADFSRLCPRPAIILRNRSRSSLVVILKLPSSPGIMAISIPSMIAGYVEPLMRRIASGSNRLLACRYLPSRNTSGACPAKTVLLSKRDVIERPSALR